MALARSICCIEPLRNGLSVEPENRGDSSRSSQFPSGNSGGNCAVLDAETSDFCASSRKTRISAEAYPNTLRKGIRSLTTKLPKSAVSGREPTRISHQLESLAAAGHFFRDYSQPAASCRPSSQCGTVRFRPSSLAAYMQVSARRMSSSFAVMASPPPVSSGRTSD